MTGFRFGIEHEVALLRPDGNYADFTNTTFDELAALIAVLPRYDSDYPSLRVGDLGIKLKRWYIEGYERYDDTGAFTVCVPKGIEIRTTIHATIAGAIAELTESMEALAAVARAAGFTPVCVSFNPFQTTYTPDPPLTSWEQRRRASSPEKRTADIPMLTQGPDLNISRATMTTADVIAVGQKLTALSPALVPFSFSSPFAAGQRWDGLSYRTYRRTGARPSAMVFVDDPSAIIDSAPSLTKRARVPAEAGRIEFKAFDSCADFRLYAGLLALLKGLAIDQTIPDRRLTPSVEAHQHAARVGFADDAIAAAAARALDAARTALGDDPDVQLLAPLQALLDARATPAQPLIDAYNATGSITAALRMTSP
ncbi:MAG: glutamate-cysteine ligase family protein, partial [Dehalococcoidia bacterium]|nr:glutamate-cysteine ligase family protein [Dehalococcoidia bacterium]